MSPYFVKRKRVGETYYENCITVDDDDDDDDDVSNFYLKCVIRLPVRSQLYVVKLSYSRATPRARLIDEVGTTSYIRMRNTGCSANDARRSWKNYKFSSTSKVSSVSARRSVERDLPRRMPIATRLFRDYADVARGSSAL